MHLGRASLQVKNHHPLLETPLYVAFTLIHLHDSFSINTYSVPFSLCRWWKDAHCGRALR